MIAIENNMRWHVHINPAVHGLQKRKDFLLHSKQINFANKKSFAIQGKPDATLTRFTVPSSTSMVDF